MTMTKMSVGGRGEVPAAGPHLRDGTTLDALIDGPRRRVRLRTLSDPEIFSLEQERIFGRTWQCVAHESELPAEGDSVVRFLGADPVQVTRRADGYEGRLALDAQLAARASGPAGPDVGAPDPEGAPRLEVRAGFVFGCWDPSQPGLTEYLGGMGWYLDMMMCRTRSGLEVAGAPQRWRIRANWKLPSEQFAGDGYHALTLHRSMFETGSGLNEGFLQAARSVQAASFAGGHGTTSRDSRFRMADAAAGQALLPTGVPPELATEITEVLDEAQRRFIATFPPGPSSGHVFPNMSMLVNPMPLADGRQSANFTVKVWVPVAVDEIEVLSWCMVERDAPEAFKEAMRHANISTFSISGMYEQDDAEGWISIQRALRGHKARQGWLNYSATQPTTVPAEDSPRGRLDPGEVIYRGWPRDDRQWRFWLRWHGLLTDDPAGPMPADDRVLADDRA